MRRVYLYVQDLRSSGVVRNALIYAERIARDHPTTLVAGYASGLFAEAARRGCYEFVALGRQAGFWGRIISTMRLRRWLARQPGGVLMSVGNLGHPSVYWGSLGLARFRLVYRISNAVERDDRHATTIRLWWMRRLVRGAARIVLVGNALGRSDLFEPALREGRAIEIPNGVDAELARRLASWPAPHSWLEDRAIPVVLGIGRLRPQKNFDLLIAAAAQARRNRRLRLIILGGGTPEEADRLRRLADEAGLAPDFLLAGETDNVFAWLSRSDVFALPSAWEGSSMALLEALAVGTPVIASRCAGDAAQVLGDGRYGLLFDGVDASALADAILRQLSNDVVRPGDRADHYGLSADAYCRVIDDVLREAAATV